MDSDADDSSLESYIPVDFSKGPLYFGNMRWDPGRVRVAFVPDSPVVQAHQGIVLLNKKTWSQLEMYRWCSDNIKENIRLYRSSNKPVKKRAKGLRVSKQHRRYMPHSKARYIKELYKQMRDIALNRENEFDIDAKYLKPEYQ